MLEKHRLYVQSYTKKKTPEDKLPGRYCVFSIAKVLKKMQIVRFGR